MPEPGFYPDIPEDTYHADPGSLSVSGAKTLLKAPALFDYQRTNPVHKDVFDEGSAAHKLVLGVGNPIEEIKADSWRTKAAQAARDAAYEVGHIPVLTETYLRVQEMAEAIKTNAAVMALLTDGAPEISAWCLDEATGVMRRGRFDYLGPRVIVDYKTAANASPEAFRKACVDYGYAMQAAWYLDLAADLGHPAEGFGFIAQEKTPPYLVEIYDLDDDFLDWGRNRNRLALEIYRDCTAAGSWPGYTPTGITTLSAPRWLVAS